MENNLAETAFYIQESDLFSIRWFTPEVEIDLCGHATLASTHVLFTWVIVYKDDVIRNRRQGSNLYGWRNQHLVTSIIDILFF